MLAAGATAGEPIREIQPGSAKKQPPASTAPSTPTTSFLDRLANQRSLGSGINPGSLPDTAAPVPFQPGKMDPESQRRWALIYDKQKNWLIENAARINSPGKASNGDGAVAEKRDASMDTVAKVSAERLRRATERDDGKVERTKSANKDPLDPNATDEPGTDGTAAKKKGKNGESTDDPSQQNTGIAFVVGELGNADRATDSARSALGNDLFKASAFQNPNDRQRDRQAERGAEFDQLLGTFGSGPGGLDTGRTALDRTHQFEAILGGGDLGGILNPAPIAAAAPGPRPDVLQTLGRVNAIQLPGMAPAPAPAAPPKFSPRPVFLQLPTRGL